MLDALELAIAPTPQTGHHFPRQAADQFPKRFNPWHLVELTIRGIRWRRWAVFGFAAFIACALVVLLSVRYRRSSRAEDEQRCAMQLATIEGFLVQYQAKYGAFPLELADLQSSGTLNDPALLKCPCDHSGKSGFRYFYPLDGYQTWRYDIWAWDESFHPDGTRNVLNFGGEVHLVPEAEFQAHLAAQRKEAIQKLRIAIKGNCEWRVVQTYDSLLYGGEPVGTKVKNPQYDKRRAEVLERLLAEFEKAQ